MIDAKDTRREVAERLRAKHRERNAPGMFEAQDLGLQAMSYLKDLESCLPDGDSMFTVIADLIDPTCDFEESADNDAFAIRVVSGYICHNCGHETTVERTAGGWTEPPRYCSNCGARMVGL